MGICAAVSPDYSRIRVTARLVADRLNETGGAAEAHVVSGEALRKRLRPPRQTRPTLTA
jgi:hypothetical protein